jgi:hypothetical protein
MEFNARVQVLGVLAEDHQVDPLAVVERIAGIGFARPQAGIQIEQLPHPHDRRSIDEAAPPQVRRELGLSRSGGLRRDGAEQRRVHPVQQLDCRRRQRVAVAAPALPSDLRGNVLGVELHLVENQTCGLQNIHADAVAWQPRNAVMGHRITLAAAFRHPAGPARGGWWKFRQESRRLRAYRAFGRDLSKPCTKSCTSCTGQRVEG